MKKKEDPTAPLKLTAAAVKRLPVGTYIDRVKDDNGDIRASYILIKSGTRKKLRLITIYEITREIKDEQGWHFERRVTK